MLCGHSKNVHLKNTIVEYTDKNFCDDCSKVYLRRLESQTNDAERRFLWHTFEDNLTYVERLSKEKNLI